MTPPSWLFRLSWRALGITHRQRVVDGVLRAASRKHPEWSSVDCERETLRVLRSFGVDLTDVRVAFTSPQSPAPRNPYPG